MKYQFHVDGRPAGPVRNRWGEAAQDAVNAGYATWGRGNGTAYMSDTVYLSDVAGAEIKRIEPK